MTDQIYRTKRGLWYFLPPLFAVIIAVVWLLALNGWIWTIVCSVAVVLMIFIFVATTYVYRRTHYTITQTSVRIDTTAGPIDIAFSKITSVDTEKDDSSPLYGMSSDVVRIKFGNSSSVIISPVRKVEFMDRLREAGLKVGD